MKKALLLYVVAYLLMLAFVLGLLYEYPKLELHMMLNAHHTSFADTFFKYYTVLAEWPLYVLGLLPLLCKKYRITLFILISEVSSGILVQILKHIFFAPRPASVFENSDYVLPVVEGVSLHHSNSFPSGHTSTFFVFATCCALLMAYQYTQRFRHKNLMTWILFNMSMLALLMFAALGGYSRIYLSQHFLSDVCVGSIIGIFTPCLVFCFGRNKILKLQRFDETR